MSNPTTTWTLLDDPASPGASYVRSGVSFDPGVDLALDDDGDMVIPPYFTTGLEAVAQGIRIRIQTFRGEWFADLDFGLPWFEDIIGQKFSDTKVREAFRAAIASTPEVDSIRRLDVTFNRSTRQLNVAWEVVTAFGTVVDTTELT